MSHKQHQQRQLNKPREKRSIPAARTKSWTLPTVLGLILGVVGALGVVELRPQMSVSPQDLLLKEEAFSAPFRIDNTGYFSFYVDHVFVYLNKVQSASYSFQVGTLHEPDWNCFVIDRGESDTIIAKLTNDAPVTADVAIVIDYQPFRYFPFYSRRYFRFVGAHGNEWEWLRQPSKSIQASADVQIADHIREIPQAGRCTPN